MCAKRVLSNPPTSSKKCLRVKNAVPDALPGTSEREEDLESYNFLQEIYRQLSCMTVPLEYKLSSQAKKIFGEYHQSMYDRFYKMTDAERFWMEPFIKRLGPSALKIAMVSQFLIQSEQDVIDEHAMMTGVSLTSYSEICTRFLFRRELGESEFQRKARVVKEYIAKRGGSVKGGSLFSSHILGGGTKEYTNMCESLEARGEILVERIDRNIKPHSKIMLVDTKG